MNEKVEGFFRVCKTAGLDGSQGVILPACNCSHLMLNAEVVAAVEQGQFHIHAIEDVMEGLELLLGMPAGELDESGGYPHNSVLGQVQKTLLHYRRICHLSEHPKPARKSRYGAF
jgi:predicted ATP-dependent protease